MPLDDRYERFYWVDVNDRIIGTISRAEAHSGSNKIHRAAVALLFNEPGTKVLLQQRSALKDMYPGYWGDSVGGHVTYGQTYDEAIYRETEEELGIANLKLVFHSKHLFNLQGEREFYAIYTGTISSNTSIQVDQDEIQQIKWVRLTEMEAFLKQEPCTPGLIQSWGKLKLGFLSSESKSDTNSPLKAL